MDQATKKQVKKNKTKYISLSTLPSLPPSHFLAEWWFPNSWMVYFMKNPIKMDDLGGTPMTSETKPCRNIYPR